MFAGGIPIVSPFAVSQQYQELVRLTVTAMLSIGIVGAAIYEQIFHPNVNSPLIGWAGTVVGVFVGHQVATQSARQASTSTLAAAQMEGVNGHGQTGAQ